MTPETKTALEASIAHWKRMRENRKAVISGTEIFVEVPGVDDCALCGLCFSKGHSCEGCPVAEHTEAELCQDTPYTAAHHAFYAEDEAAWQKAADAQIKFLESLLPK